MSGYQGSNHYRPKWGTPKDVLRKMQREYFEGTVANICCGESYVGDVRVDVDPDRNPDVTADVHDLPFHEGEFDTVYVDPPFSLYAYPDGYWPAEAWRVASRRLILDTPAKRVTLPRTTKEWMVAEPKPGSAQLSVRHMQIFEPDGSRLDEFAA